MDKTWLQFSSLSGLQIIFSSYSSIKNWNLSLMLNKYSRKTKPQLLNKPTGSFKWIQIFSMWTQSNFRHFSLLICWAMQRRRERALEALCQIVTQTTSNVEEILSAAPFSNPQLWYACASLFFLTDIRPNTVENLKLKFHHDRQEARTMNLRNDLKQKWEGEHWSSSCYKHRTGPSLQIAALTWHCRACSVSKDLGQSLFSHIPDVPGFLCSSDRYCPLRAPLSPALPHPSLWAFQQLHSAPGSPREGNPEAPPSLPAMVLESTAEKPLETNQTKNSLLELP